MASNIYKQFVIYKTSLSKAKRQQIRHHILRLANHYSDDHEDTALEDSSEEVYVGDAEEILDRPVPDIESISKNKIPTPSVSPKLKGLVDIYEDGLVENSLPEEMFFMAPKSDSQSKEVNHQPDSEKETVRPKRASLSYAAIVTRENGQYLARFPQVPGCQTFAYSVSQLRKNASEALEGWLLTSIEYNDKIAPPKPIAAKNIINVDVSPKIANDLIKYWNKSG